MDKIHVIEKLAEWKYNHNESARSKRRWKFLNEVIGGSKAMKTLAKAALGLTVAGTGGYLLTTKLRDKKK